jgi:hypothetical protein
MAEADRVAVLVELARDIARADPEFQTVKGPSVGDHATAQFMKALRIRVHEVMGGDFSERKLIGGTDYAVDFYLEPERTVVEVALGLPNPSSEYEKDILKAIVARDYVDVERLVFISRAGGEKKCAQPGRTVIRRWASKHHKLQIEVFDLGGAPRKRRSRA